MKLYVWRCALSESSSGLAVAMAETPEEAKAALIRQGLPAFYFVGTGIMTEDDVVQPRVYDGPAAAFVFGGR